MICLMIITLLFLLGLLINMDVAKFKTQIKIHEGLRREVYMDTTGNRTVGVGFNLERMDAPSRLQHVGASHHEIVTGGSLLTEDQINEMLMADIKDAERAAIDLVSNYEELNDVRQRVVVDMIFNLGARGFSKFVNTRKYISRGEFVKAADNMMRSLWARQVKGRARILSDMMRFGEDIYEF